MPTKYLDFLNSYRLVFLRIKMPLIAFYIRKFSGATLGKNPKFHGMPVILLRNGGRLIIGDNFKAKSAVISNLVGLPHPVLIAARGKNAIIKMGNNVGISGVSINCRSSITIGNNVAIGGGAGIWDHDFHPMDAGERNSNPSAEGITKPIVIEDDVFIGARALILKGVTIGKGSVIGAGAIVAKSVPPNSVVYGNPCIIKQK